MRVTLDNVRELMDWCGAIQAVKWVGKEPQINLTLKGGTILATIGSWIVKNPEGKFYLMSSEQFKAQHNPKLEADDFVDNHILLKGENHVYSTWQPGDGVHSGAEEGTDHGSADL
jgi:hypothetical protein